MTPSEMESIFQTTVLPPTEQVLNEEVIITKEASTQNLAYSLVEYASFTYQLNTQAHLLHINIESSLFFSLHEFLKAQYEQHIADFDIVSELVRSMDFLLPMCQCGLMDAYKDFDSVKTHEAKEALIIYTKNLEKGGFMAKDVVDMARQVGAPDVENELATITGNCFKSAWMMKATLRKLSSI